LPCGPDPNLQAARDSYYQGAEGAKDGFSRAEKLFGRLWAECPRDPVIQVYVGSLKLASASHTWALWKRNSLSREGMQLMNDAVSKSPSDLEIRFVRAVTTYNLPFFFHVRDQSRADFAFLASRVEPAARASVLPSFLAAAALYFHAEFLQDDGKTSDAVRFWQRAIALAPQSRAARDSQAELKRLHEH